MSNPALEYESLLNRLQRVDFFLLGCIALVLCMGLTFIASAVHGMPEGSGGFLLRQILFIAMGLTVFVALQRVHYLVLLRQAPLLYLIGLLLLCGVFATRPINGARSWYNLYFFKLQPAELMKPILILTLAYYLMYRDSYKQLKGLIFPMVLAAVPLVLILKQPDLGTTMAMAPVALVMLFVAGARKRHLALVCASGFAGTVLMWFFVMKDYQKRRVLAWLYPENYRLAEAWQTIKAEIAIGSGGLWGKGWGESSQSNLPEHHTDFIYAVAAEEGGLLTAGLMLVLMYLAALSGLGIAARTREPAGRLIAVGCVTILATQVLINTGVNLGMLPTTGLTFPFVSYGGSSILSSFICLGLLVNIGTQQEVVLSKESFG